MTRLTREVRINAPKEKVWEILADFGGISKFNPNVSTSYCTSEANSGVGATRHCDLSFKGASLEERIVEWREGHSYTIEIYQGKNTPPFKTARASISVRKDGNASIVTGTFDYSLKYGLLGVLMDKLMVQPQFSRAWSHLFAGLKYYAETGEPVEAHTPVNLTEVVAVA
jgi:carbon monoxide dehydrogenase subunit G